MQGMHRWIVEFALVFTAMAVIYEILALISGKRLWNLMAKLHIGIAAGAMFLSAFTGIIDLRFAWMSADGKQLMASHRAFGFVIFFLILILANYRLLLQN